MTLESVREMTPTELPGAQIPYGHFVSVASDGGEDPMSQTRAARPRQLDASKAIRQGIKLQRQGKLGEAEKIYRGVLANQPDHFDALHMLGVIRLSQGKALEANDLISKALAIDGQSWRALYNYGRVLSTLGRHEEAVVRFELSLAIEAAQPDVLFHCGSALHRLNRLEDVLASRVIAIKADHVAALWQLALRAQALRGSAGEL